MGGIVTVTEAAAHDRADRNRHGPLRACQVSQEACSQN